MLKYIYLAQNRAAWAGINSAVSFRMPLGDQKPSTNSILSVNNRMVPYSKLVSVAMSFLNQQVSQIGQGQFEWRIAVSSQGHTANR
jgi:hypothetical protein